MKTLAQALTMAVLCISLTACTSSEEKAVQRVFSAVSLPDGTAERGLLLWAGELQGGTAVVLQAPVVKDSGESAKYFAFWVDKESIYAVNAAAAGLLKDTPVIPAPVTLEEIVDAIEDLPDEAEQDLRS